MSTTPGLSQRVLFPQALTEAVQARKGQEQVILPYTTPPFVPSPEITQIPIVPDDLPPLDMNPPPSPPGPPLPVDAPIPSPVPLPNTPPLGQASPPSPPQAVFT